MNHRADDAIFHSHRQTDIYFRIVANARSGPTRIHDRVLRDSVSNCRDQQIGNGQLRTVGFFNGRPQPFVRSNQFRAIHIACQKEMRNTGPALSHSLGHQPRDLTQRFTWLCERN